MNPLKLSNKNYDRLKFVTQIVLPAVGTLYVALAALWGLPKPTEVVGTIVAVDTFLGVLLGITAKGYLAGKDAEGFDGTIKVSRGEDGQKKAAMVLYNYEDPADVVKQKTVKFRVEEH